MKRKIFKILLSLSILIGLNACSDFLDQPVLGEDLDIPAYYDNVENANMAIMACYNGLTYEDNLATFQWIYGDVMSDDAWKGGGSLGDAGDMNYMKQWNAISTNLYVTNTWKSYYRAIHRANVAIKALNEVTFNDKLVKQFIGEAKFIRAYSYFVLVKLYGDVPLTTQPVPVNQIGKLGRSSFDDVLTQIEQDLKDAAENLPPYYDAKDLGRVTSYAAKGLHARVIMYEIGMFRTKSQTEWKVVSDLTDEIINSGYYRLMSNYAEIFEAEGENSIESLFEIQYATTNTGYGFDNAGSSSCIYVANRGTEANPEWGWGFNCPTQSLVDEFETGDPRLYCTIHGNGITDYVYGVKQVVGKTEYLTGYHSRKLALDPVLRPANHSDSPSNLRILRFSDILLMKAEAAFNMGNESLAREYVNKVRARARISTYPKGFEAGTKTYKPTGFTNNLPDVIATGANLLKAIKHERRVELGMESLRYWDLLRWGDYKAVLPTNVQNRFDRSQLRGVPVIPIPAEEVIGWGLEQNPN